MLSLTPDIIKKLAMYNQISPTTALQSMGLDSSSKALKPAMEPLPQEKPSPLSPGKLQAPMGSPEVANVPEGPLSPGVLHQPEPKDVGMASGSPGGISAGQAIGLYKMLMDSINSTSSNISAGYQQAYGQAQQNIRSQNDNLSTRLFGGLGLQSLGL